MEPPRIIVCGLSAEPVFHSYIQAARLTGEVAVLAGAGREGRVVGALGVFAVGEVEQTEAQGEMVGSLPARAQVQQVVTAVAVRSEERRVGKARSGRGGA